MNSLTEENRNTSSSSKLFWAVMALGILLVAGLVTYFVLSPSPPAPSEARLENAIREGSPEFEALKSRIAVQENRDFTTQSQNMTGNIEMNLVGLVRNFTGKTLVGLEVVASVVDEKGNVLKEKTTIVIPSNQIQQIENSKTAPFSVRIAGFNPQDDRSDFRFRVTGLKVQ